MHRGSFERAALVIALSIPMISGCIQSSDDGDAGPGDGRRSASGDGDGASGDGDGFSGDGDGSTAALSECLARTDSIDSCETYCQRRGQTCSDSCQIWPDINVGAAGISFDLNQCGGDPGEGLMIPSCSSSIILDAEFQCCCDGEPTSPDGFGKAPGEACGAYWECQSLSCGDTGCGTCAALGEACSFSDGCCEGFCSGGTCQTGCADDFGGCLINSDCCSGICDAGRCDFASNL